MDTYDAIVIGSGPNGLVAAIELGRKGWDVLVVERNATPGGAVRSAAMTQPGFIHDPYSAFYGLLHSTPVFADLDLGTRVQWASFDTPVGALVDPNTGAYVHRDVNATAAALGKVEQADADAWLRWWDWWQSIGQRFFSLMLAPLPSIKPGLRFLRATGIRGALPTAHLMVEPVSAVAAREFSSEAARTLFVSGVSHTDLSVDSAASMPVTMILAMLAQAYNMPVPVGGAGKLTEGLLALVDEHRGTVRLGDAVTRVVIDRGRAVGVETASGGQVRARHAVLADTGARALFQDLVGADNLPGRFLDGLQRIRYGTGMFKVDIALDAPPSWAEEGARSCGVVHVTGDMRNMARGSFEAHNGLLPSEPMLVVGQPTLADPTRAPAGGHVLWVETHVPPHPTADDISGKTFDGWRDAKDLFAERVVARLERHAPGLREHIVGIAVNSPDDLAGQNPNLVGGDVGGGSSALDQQLVFRPVPGWFRYKTPVKGLYLCSASAHPGGGVHGMSGRNAARAALKASWKPGGVLKTASRPRRSR